MALSSFLVSCTNNSHYIDGDVGVQGKSTTRTKKDARRGETWRQLGGNLLSADHRLRWFDRIAVFVDRAGGHQVG